MLRTVLVLVVGIVVVFAGVVALRPAEFRVTRAATIAAPAHAVFAHVNDFHKWDAWSPWAKLDPGMQQRYDGAPAGVGAVYRWRGNKDVGEGRMTVTESRPGELVRIRLEFIKPFPATNTAEFTFSPEGDRTRVTWTMTGRNTFVAKAVHLFIDMDAMVGGYFEKGLAGLSAAVEMAAPRIAR